ncbi:MAG: hypothetical protein H0U56_05240 [Methylibium sp.]|uniref:hypothetical protein n=1 Tax=Methylibium sp. TaxID=2067992 RepID=UPI0017CA5A70|nr:hypothetical protein [Methylibium sp.]MBA2722293.1 hypothetical protein [Methylibium sp.]MBA3590459.1 hypothetical protein [Methylibium sp.]
MNSSGDITMWMVWSLRGLFELERELSGGIALHPFVGQRRARDGATGATHLLEPLALVGAAAHDGGLKPCSSENTACASAAFRGIVKSFCSPVCIRSRAHRRAALRSQ